MIANQDDAAEASLHIRSFQVSPEVLDERVNDAGAIAHP